MQNNQRKGLSLMTIAVIGFCVFTSLYTYVTPIIQNGTYTTNGVKNTFGKGIDAPPQHAETVVEFDLITSAFSPTKYILYPYSCIHTYVINSEVIPKKMCSYLGERIDASLQLTPGKNTLAFTFETSDAPLRFHIIPSPNFYVLSIYVGLVLCAILGLVGGLWVLEKNKYKWIGCAIVTGITLRIVYMLSTPYFVRAWDWDGHLEYINYLIMHHAIPNAHSGWEMHQAPLYYIATAFIKHTAVYLHFSQAKQLLLLQSFSLLLSITTLIIMAWVSRILFAKRANRIALIMLTAVFPAYIFTSSRISNDALLLPISLVAFGLLVSWWKHTKTHDWYLLCTTLGIGMLTKMNIAPLLAATAICLILQKKLKLKRKIIIGIHGLTILCVLTGWYLFLRIFIEGQDQIVPVTFSGSLFLQNSWLQYIIFNPLEVLHKPFNWNWNDDFRRNILWEYFFKSAYTGEWIHKKPSIFFLRTLLSFHLIATLHVLRGIWLSIRNGQWFTDTPIWSTASLLFAALVLYRFDTGNVSAQDFRFIPLIYIPTIYYLLNSVESSSKTIRTVTYGGMSIYCISAIAYVICIISVGTANY